MWINVYKIVIIFGVLFEKFRLEIINTFRYTGLNISRFEY